MMHLLAQADSPAASFWHLELRSPWPSFLVLVAVAAAVVLAIYLYHDRGSRLGRPKQVLLTVCRAMLLAIIAVMLFEPVLAIETAQPLRRNVLVMLDTSASMAIADARTSPEAKLEAAKLLGLVPFEADGSAMSPSVLAQLSEVSRIDLAQALLSREEGGNVFAELDREHKTRYFTFASDMSAVGSDGPATRETLAQASPDGQSTRLGSLLDQVVANYGGQPIAGIVLLTDGASNLGVSPTQVARQLGDQDVPLFPIGVGLPNPPDVRLRRVIVPETVFLKDTVPLRAEITSTGYSGQPLDVTATLAGEVVGRTTITLAEGSQFIELPFVPERRTGSAELEIAVSQLPGETSSDNNRQTRPIRIIDEKIKVLYVEGAPRWEYRYLRQVLLRDHRLDVKFLMTEGDRELATTSQLFLESFPDVTTEAYDFDLIILGDVPASYFTQAQLARMQDSVQKQGASLLMLAGGEHAASYVGTPVEPVLPVRLTRGVDELPEDVTAVITPEGSRSGFVQLTVPETANQALWNLVHPMHRVPRVEGAKPGATVLMTLSDQARRREAYPLIAWQRYGSGRSLYVGTDQLWRLRFKRGDQFHARFWGQAIQFLTLSRLLGENRRVRIELPGSQFNVGQRIEIGVSALNESYGPVLDPSYRLDVYRDDQTTPMQTFSMQAVTGIAGLFQGTFTPTEPGRYRFVTAGVDPADVQPVEIRVEDAPLEQLEPAMQRQQLMEMAQLSGGRYIEAQDLPQLPQLITGETRHVLIRREEQLWDHWAVFVAILSLASLEWFVRRRSTLV